MADVDLHIEIIGGIDWTQLGARLADASRKVLTDAETDLVEFFSDAWVGWKYKKRPKSAPRLVSHDGWRGKIVSTDEGPKLAITNETLGWRSKKPYVAFIKRSKGQEQPEWVLVLQDAQAEFGKKLGAALVDAISKELTKPKSGRRKVRPSGGKVELLELGF